MRDRGTLPREFAFAFVAMTRNAVTMVGGVLRLVMQLGRRVYPRVHHTHGLRPSVW